MKKYFTLLCLLITAGAFAQQQIPKSLILQPTEVRTLPPSRGGVGDTLFWSTGDGSTPALYRIPDPFTPGDIAGYIAGTDQLNSSFTEGEEDGNFVSEEAQMFNNTNQIKLIGVKFCFGAKKYVSGNHSSRMLFRLYRNDDVFTNSNSQVVTGPGTLLSEVAVRLDSIKILLSGIDNLYTGSQQIVFPTPITVDSGYTFGICLDSLDPLDTIGLFTCTLNAVHPPNMSVVKFVDGIWANYADTTGNGWGYDLDLAIFPIVDFTQYDTISANVCLGSSYNYNGTNYNTTGIVDDTILRDGGTYLYDSIVTINLTVNPDTTVLASGDTLLTARAGNGATYQWIDCATQQPINGATLAEFKPGQPGHYEVRVMQNGCTGTSSCHAALISGIRELEEVQFDLRPNPTRDMCTIYPGDAHGTWNGSLYNMQGQLVQHLFTGQDMQAFTFSTASLPQGIYLIKVNTNDGKTGVQKLVVE